MNMSMTYIYYNCQDELTLLEEQNEILDEWYIRIINLRYKICPNF